MNPSGVDIARRFVRGAACVFFVIATGFPGPAVQAHPLGAVKGLDPLAEAWRWNRLEGIDGRLNLGFVCVAPDGRLCLVGGRNQLRVYDGFEIHPVPAPEAIASDFVSGFLVTSRGDWVVQTRQAVFLRRQGNWERVIDSGHWRRSMSHLVEGREGVLWMGCGDSLWRVDPDTLEALRTPSPGVVRSLCEGPERDSLWVSVGRSGVVYEVPFDPAGNLLPPEQWVRRREAMSEELLDASLLRLRDGRIVYINRHHRQPISIFDPERGEWTDINLSALGGDNFDFSALETRDGALWVASRGVLHVLRGEDWTVYRSPQYPVPGARSMLVEDAEGYLLLAEQGGVTQRLDYAGKKGASFEELHFQGNTAAGEEIFLSLENAVVVHSATGRVESVMGPEATGIALPSALRVLSNGDWILVGTDAGAAAVSIYRKGVWQRHRFPGMALSIGHLGVLERRNGEIWVGCAQEPEEFSQLSGGVMVFKPTNSGVYTVEHRLPPAVPYRNWSLQEGPDGWVYVSGNGLFRTNGERTVEISLPEPLRAKWIDQIAFDGQGALWAVSWGSGAFRRKGGEWTTFSASDGLESLLTSFLLIDADGAPVVTTQDGIFRFDGTRWSPFMTPHGGLYRGSGHLVAGRDGRIWINRTHVDWYYRGQRVEDYAASKEAGFRTVEYRPDEAPPETVWTRPPNELTRSGAVTMRWAGIDAWSVTPSSLLEYSYRVGNQPWTPFGPDQSVLLEDLAGGEHRIEVRSRDADGNTDPTPLVAAVTVLVPLWKQGWFIGLWVGVLLLLISAIVVVIRQRVRHLLELEQVKLRVFTHLSHEIKTPLSLILGPVERLQDEVQDGQHQHFLSLIKTNSQRLLHLVNQLLDFRKFQLSKLDFQPERADFVPFARQCIEVFHSWARENRQSLVFETDLDGLVFRFDQELFHKVIDNLVNNAVKYSPEGGSIRVRVERREEDGAALGRLSVIDTGPGIPAHEREQIFEPFYRGEKHSGRQEGSGIGLALVRELTGVMGGRIEVESPVQREAARDSGTAFHVTFPLLDEGPFIPLEPAEKSIDESETSTAASTRGEEHELVLLVEDNDELRAFLQSELAGTFRVVTARHAEEGLEKARELLPDVVITDVVMSGADGFGLCHTLKNDRRTSHLAVILLTALRSDEHKRRAFESGADDFLTKPVPSALLRLKVKNLLQTQRRNRERVRDQFAENIRPTGLAAPDQAFLDEVEAVVEAHLGDENFDVVALAKAMGMSRSAFYRKFNSLTELSPAAYIKTRRLRRAARWLVEGGRNVTEVAFGVGFSDTGYFGRVFKEEYQCTPSKFARRNRPESSEKTVSS